MSQQLHYTADLRDLEFNLFEFLEVGSRALGKGPFGSLDEETARESLRQLERLCVEKMAACYTASDREVPVLHPDGSVTLPDAVKAAIDTYQGGDWHRLELPEHLGGFGAPPTVTWAAFELLAGSAPVVCFYVFGSFMARIIDRLGTESQRARYLPQIVDRLWGGAMVLTEPDAGSDVGSARTSARHLHDDVWAIEGVKRFITNGEYDYAENIVHMVLARPEGAGGGTKGLSMFIVPKIWVEADGSLGGPNGVRCSGLEKKMGIKGSVTCEMTYGDSGQCRGLLVGGVHDGIRQMFHIIEQARMAVGVKSIATLSAGYFQALAYTKERVQGPDLKHAADKDSPRVRIIEHPDVRRMLMTQKAHATGMRAMAMFAASLQDEVELLGGHTAKEARALSKLSDLLLPLIKGYCSERVYELLSLSLQCFGGSGYCQDYPVEQYIRDQKIDTLYEGTTAIQALDLLLRKIARDGGKTLQLLLGRVEETLKSAEGGDAFAEERALLARGLADIQGTFLALMGKVQESVYHAGLVGNRVLFGLAELTIGWLLLRHAALAQRRLDEGATGSDARYYEGKVAAARWYLRDVLPGLTLTRKRVEGSRLDLMELDESVF